MSAKQESARLSDRSFVSADLARFLCETADAFADVEVNNDGSPEHEPNGDCWISVRVRVRAHDIDHRVHGARP
jgi:hypothetical protein